MEQQTIEINSTVSIIPNIATENENNLKQTKDFSPSTLEFSPITLAEQKRINEYLGKTHYNTLEYNFTTLFIWQESYHFSWAEQDHVLYIRSCYHGETKFFPPILKDTMIPCTEKEQVFQKAVQNILNYCNENHITPVFEEITENDREKMVFTLKNDFLIEANRNLANYIYYVSVLTNLKGRSFNGKRNHIRRFERENPDFQFLPLTEELLAGCRKHAEGWYHKHPEKDSITLQEEKIAILKTLDHFHQLHLKGGCILMNGKVEAFAIGEPLNETMAVIHFEKGNLEIGGIYTALNKYFLEQSWQDYLLVNRGEDLGNPGLRKAKKDYKPAWLEMKYTAKPKE